MIYICTIMTDRNLNDTKKYRVEFSLSTNEWIYVYSHLATVSENQDTKELSIFSCTEQMYNQPLSFLVWKKNMHFYMKLWIIQMVFKLTDPTDLTLVWDHTTLATLCHPTKQTIVFYEPSGLPRVKFASQNFLHKKW